MYTRGLRPFQSVVYVTDSIKENMEWKGLKLVDLFYFSKIWKYIGDNELETILILNAENNKANLINPLPLGIETLMRNWYHSADEAGKERLDKLKLQHSLRKLSSALETTLKSDVDLPAEFKKGYDIVDDENQIYVVLKKNECNLLDKNVAKQLVGNISRDIVKVLTAYHGYKNVPANPWFKQYIENL